MVEKIALEDEGVKAELAKLGLPEGTGIISDPWIYGMFSPSFAVITAAYLARNRRYQ